MKQKQREILELYSDYLMSSFGLATATGLSEIIDGAMSHDVFTRFLNGGKKHQEYGSKDLWHLVKPLIRQFENEQDGVIIFDDTIEEKPYTDENDIVCWHFDHVSGNSVKGINILNCMFHTGEATLPLSYEVVHKDISWTDLKTRKVKRKSRVTKNEMLQSMLFQIQANQVLYKYVLADAWFSCVATLKFIKNKMKKDFVMAIKSNRNIALSQKDKNKKKFVHMEDLDWEEHNQYKIWLEGVPFPMLLIKQVFTNKDGSTGILYLIASDLGLTTGEIQDIYKKRWCIEVFHKSEKSNACLEKSPTKTVTSQLNHIFSSVYAVVKLEQMKLKHHMNHFALRAKIYITATKFAFQETQRLKSCQGCGA